MKIITNCKIVTKDEVLKEKSILFNEKIIDIIDNSFINDYKYKEKIDAKGKYVFPGFIDIHIHGSGGYDVMDGTITALEEISKTVASKGVTGFLATTMTMDKFSINQAFDTVRKGMEEGMPGGKILGVHMEGPFISKEKMGAQNPEYIMKPNYDLLEDYLDIIKIITLAPEEDENYNFMRKIKSNNPHIVLSIGHTNASYEKAMESIKNGITHATHTYNAMTPLNHREPGVVGAIMNSDITCELIADGIHVHPGAINILIKAKGTEKIILVTDSMRAGCINEGTYELGGQEVIVKDGLAKLKDGTLAGSILTMNTALKNIVQNTDLNLSQAANMLSQNPANLLGLGDVKGSISPGKDADLVIVDDGYQVDKTIISGDVVYTGI